MRQVALITFFFFLFQNNTFAQKQGGSIAAPTSNTDTVYNSEPLLVRAILFKGNRVTHERILLRELTFKKADTIPVGELGKKLITSRQNLLNTSLFNFATISHTQDSGIIDVTIDVIERWYIWPLPIFEIAEPNFNTWWLNKDFNRTNYGMFITHENFRGRKESLRFKAQLGFTHQFALQYNVPYVNKKQTVGLGLTTSYNTNKEIFYKTENNKRVSLKDKESYVREEFYTRLNVNIRNAIYNRSSIQVKYNWAHIQDSITILSNDYFPNNETTTQYLTVGYYFKRDRRDYQPYPLKGYLFDIDVIKTGLDLLKNTPDVMHVVGQVRKYWKFNEKFFYSAQVKTKRSFPAVQPYYLQRGMGYGNDLVRGYEYYIIDGQHWYLAKTNFKYRIIAPRVSKIPMLGSQKFNTFHYAFYFNLFADAGYVQDDFYFKENPLNNSLLFGYGAGLDFVTYYDFVIRLEYSFNKLGENGFFLNFGIPF